MKAFEGKMSEHRDQLRVRVKLKSLAFTERDIRVITFTLLLVIRRLFLTMKKMMNEVTESLFTTVVKSKRAYFIPSYCMTI